jgi:hypothetical protein
VTKFVLFFLDHVSQLPESQDDSRSTIFFFVRIENFVCSLSFYFY